MASYQFRKLLDYFCSSAFACVEQEYLLTNFLKSFSCSSVVDGLSEKAFFRSMSEKSCFGKLILFLRVCAYVFFSL